MTNILSFDVEEYFQVSGLEKAVSRNDWHKYQSRVGLGTKKILEILGHKKTKATFFFLGCIAEKHPDLVRDVAAAGHEIACHGWDHRLLYHMNDDEFEQDVGKTKRLLEDISGKKVIGYRAPSFSLNADDRNKIKILANLGFKYDSSMFPMKHFRYGKAESVPRAPFEIKLDETCSIREYPMTVVDLMGKTIPAGGGGYLRFYPGFFIKRNFRKVNASGRPVIIYLHPWEFDPEQPRIKGAGFGNTFRHYHNLKSTAPKLEMILEEFRWGAFEDDTFLRINRGGNG